MRVEDPGELRAALAALLLAHRSLGRIAPLLRRTAGRLTLRVRVVAARLLPELLLGVLRAGAERRLRPLPALVRAGLLAVLRRLLTVRLRLLAVLRLRSVLGRGIAVLRDLPLLRIPLLLVLRSPLLRLVPRLRLRALRLGALR